MKKTLFFIAAIIWTACSSDHVQEVSLLDKGRILIIEATKGQADTRGLALDGNTLNAIWSKDDVVTVLSASGSVLGTLKPETTGSSSTTLKSTSPISVSKGDKLTLVFPRTDRDYTGQKGTLEDIETKYDYATASVTVQDINGSSASTTQATFENKQAIVKFTLTDDNGQAIYANSLTIAADGLLQTESTTGPITITPTPATNVIYAALSGVNGKVKLTANIVDNPTSSPTSTTYIAYYYYSYAKPNVTFTNNKFYSVNVKMNRDLMRSTPLTLESSDVDGCEVSISGGYSNLEYYLLELNKTPEGWKTYPNGTVNGNIQLSKGEWVSFRGTNATAGSSSSGSERMKIQCSGKCFVYGNVMSLLNKDNFATMVDLPYDSEDEDSGHTFQDLFMGNENIFHDDGKDLVLPATKLVPYCYYQMFSGCKNLNYVKCLATDISAESCTTYWLLEVPEDGTFVKAEGFDGWTLNSDSGIPQGWTVTEE